MTAPARMRMTPRGNGSAGRNQKRSQARTAEANQPPADSEGPSTGPGRSGAFMIGSFAPSVSLLPGPVGRGGQVRVLVHRVDHLRLLDRARHATVLGDP